MNLANRMNRRDIHEKILSITLSIVLSFSIILIFLNSFTLIAFDNSYVFNTYLVYLILFFLLIYSLIYLLKKIQLDVLVILLFFFISYVITFALFPANRIYMFTQISDIISNPLYIFILFGFIPFLISRNLKDLGTLMKALKITSIIVVFISTCSYIISMLIVDNLEYMSFSYSIMPFTIFLLILSQKEKRLFLLSIGFLGLLLIFFTGARGPLVISILSILFYNFLGFELSRNSFIKILVLLFFCLIIFFFWQPTISLIFTTLSDLGIDSRTLDYIINENFFNDSGRLSIFSQVFDSINIFGHGLYGDRIILNGSYSHNIILEFFADFGILIGLLINITLLMSFFVLSRTKNTNLRILFIVFFASGYMKLMISSSYLSFEPSFYILLGLSISNIINSKSTLKHI